MLRECDNQTCVICAQVITVDQDGCVCTVPTKRLQKFSAKTKASLVVKWDASKVVNCFHASCYDGLSTRKLSSVESNVLKSVEEVVERFSCINNLRSSIRVVAEYIRAANGRVVCFTGAGISAASGIPTYRGSSGIDTLAALTTDEHNDNTSATRNSKKRSLEEGVVVSSTKKGPAATATVIDLEDKDDEEEGTDYTALKPTYTHRFLASLQRAEQLSYVITQNCDDLHAKGGLPRSHLSELHGNVFIEYCDKCYFQYIRDYCVDAYSTDCSQEKWYRECATCGWNHFTGRTCTIKGCKGKLRDTIVNFGDMLFEGTGPSGVILGGLDRARAESNTAKVCLCMGSSLTVTPANELPLLADQLVIVNPQATELDDSAVVRLWAASDIVCKLLAEELFLTVEEV